MRKLPRRREELNGGQAGGKNERSENREEAPPRLPTCRPRTRPDQAEYGERAAGEAAGCRDGRLAAKRGHRERHGTERDEPPSPGRALADRPEAESGRDERRRSCRNPGVNRERLEHS